MHLPCYRCDPIHVQETGATGSEVCSSIWGATVQQDPAGSSDIEKSDKSCATDSHTIQKLTNMYGNPVLHLHSI